MEKYLSANDVALDGGSISNSPSGAELGGGGASSMVSVCPSSCIDWLFGGVRVKADTYAPLLCKAREMSSRFVYIIGR